MIREFIFIDDYPIVEKWWLDHGQKPVPPVLIPVTGFINESACVFLLKTDGAIAFIDCLVSDPDAIEDRDEKIDEVVEAAVAHAKKSGYKFVYAFTQKDSVVKRALKHGFVFEDKYSFYQRRL